MAITDSRCRRAQADPEGRGSVPPGIWRGVVYL